MRKVSYFGLRNHCFFQPFAQAAKTSLYAHLEALGLPFTKPISEAYLGRWVFMYFWNAEGARVLLRLGALAMVFWFVTQDTQKNRRMCTVRQLTWRQVTRVIATPPPCKKYSALLPTVADSDLS